MTLLGVVKEIENLRNGFAVLSACSVELRMRARDVCAEARETAGRLLRMRICAKQQNMAS